jgi:hypothetical protein
VFHRRSTPSPRSPSSPATAPRGGYARARRLRPAALALAVLLAAGAAACGSRQGGGGQDASAGSMVVTGGTLGSVPEQARDADRVRLALLTPDDVVAGGASPAPTTPPAAEAAPEGVAAGRCVALDPALESAFRLTEDVPSARSEALTGRPEDRLRIQHDVSLLASAADAATVLAAQRTPAFAECVRLVAGDEVRRAATAAGAADGGEAAASSVTVAPGPSISAGDETTSLAATVAGPAGNATHVLVSVVRVDRGLSTVTVFADAQPEPATIETVARRAADRLHTVLDAP